MRKPFHKGAKNELFGFAKKMRKHPTEAEKVLWEALKNRQVGGFKFRRQHPLASYILDFYCHEKKLGIELDGGYHNDTFQKEYDQVRTEILNVYGINVIRFPNQSVIQNLNQVLENILLELKWESSE